MAHPAATPDAEPQAPAHRCVACDAEVPGTFCGACGEKRADLRDLRLRTFLRDALESLTDADARAYRTFRVFFTRPGQLTADYVTGRRRMWLSPLQLFLAVNLVFFLVASLLPVRTFTTSLYAHTEMQWYSGMARQMLWTRVLAAEEFDMHGYQQRFDAASEQYAKSLVIVLVPLLAGFLALVRARRREPFTQHLVFTLHTVAWLLVVLMGVGALRRLGGLVFSPGAVQPYFTEETFAVLVLLGLGAFLHPALRRVYGTGRAASAAIALGVFVVLIPAISVYRLILFLAVYHTI
jgi:hypothetical protein